MNRSRPLRRSVRGLGTEIELCLWPAPGHRAAAAAALALSAVFLRRAETRLSRFLPDSDISRLNAHPGRPLRVSRLTFRLVRAALAAARATAGLFDPTVYAALLAAGYDRSFEELSAHCCPGTGRPTISPGGRYRDVVLNRAVHTVTLPHGTGLDLGGIAKGWLADAIVRRLERHGVAFADLGGDIALSRPAPGDSPWEVEVADPRNAHVTVGILRAPGGGVATSGILRRRWQTADGPRHHVIDPRTGRPAVTDLLSATILAPNAAAAEVAATVALLLGRDGARRALDTSPGLAGILVPEAGAPFFAGGSDRPPDVHVERRP